MSLLVGIGGDRGNAEAVSIDADEFTPWLSASDYQAGFDRQAANGFYPREVEGRNSSGVSEFRGRFVPFPPDPFIFSSIHGHEEGSYEDLNTNFLAQGYTQIHLQTFVDGEGITRYQSTWTKGIVVDIEDLSPPPPPPPPSPAITASAQSAFTPDSALAQDFAFEPSTDQSTYLVAAANPSSPECHQIRGPSMPAGTESYAAPYNVMSSSRELLMRTRCDVNGNVTINVGNGNSSQYTYFKGYYWDGIQWIGYEYDGTDVEGTTDWYSGNANASITPPQLQMTNGTYILAYICQYDLGGWKCGCRDLNCTTSHWNLQIAKEPDCPPQSGKENLVFVTHGWNSDINKWAQDMVRKIKGRVDSTNWDVCAYDWSEKAGGTPTEAWGEAATEGGNVGQVIFSRHYKYVHFANLPELLFDLTSDPEELINIAQEHPEIVAKYAKKLLSWRMKTTDRTLTHLQVSREAGLTDMSHVDTPINR